MAANLQNLINFLPNDSTTNYVTFRLLTRNRTRSQNGVRITNALLRRRP